MCTLCYSTRDVAVSMHTCMFTRTVYEDLGAEVCIMHALFFGTCQKYFIHAAKTSD